jgi:electron transfer flavoprotein beta subunit
MKSLNIIVCIKPVPDSKYWDKLHLDPATRTLRREGIPTVISPLDFNAIEEALRIKESRSGSKVTVVTMGPPNGTEILAWAYAFGVDDAVLLTDRALAGADTWATAYAIAAGIKKIGNFDLVILGNESLDGSTGQVGPQVAEFLGIPHITYVEKIEFTGDTTLQARSKIENGYMLVEAKLPVALAVTKAINDVRVPPVFGALWATEKKTTVWTAADVGVDKTKVGLAGSPTSVSDVSTIEMKRRGQVLTGDPSSVVKQLIEKLRSDGVLS